MEAPSWPHVLAGSDGVAHKCGRPTAMVGPGDRHPHCYVVTARARSFLYHQVRFTVGLLKAVGTGNLGLHDVRRILEARTPTAQPAMAPPFGLYLAKVAYSSDDLEEPSRRDDSCALAGAAVEDPAHGGTQVERTLTLQNP
eukprot:SM000222S06993  [mRNA]  locus=s222:180206:181294:- [translate_table: standard]